MPDSTIPTWFVQQFRDQVENLPQQNTSRLRSRIREDPDNLEGKAGYFERLGLVEMQEVFDRHGDTTLTEQPHSRRRIITRTFDLASVIDRRDMRRIKVSGLPAKYEMNMRRAVGRKYDDLIIAAALGNAYSMDEDDAAATVALPAAQKIAHGSSGLTVAKLRTAKQKLDAAEVDEEFPRTLVCSSHQLNTDLLATTEVTSQDYNSVKALVKGEIDTFLGFKFIRSERLTLDGNGDRQVIAFAQPGIGLAKGEEIFVDVGPRRDKRVGTQVFVEMDADATRIHDDMVVEIACRES